MRAPFSDPHLADHWWCSDCGHFDRVDDRDLCIPCAEQHDLARLLDMVLTTDELAYRLEEAHWNAWHTLTEGPDWQATTDRVEREYHIEAEVCLSRWLVFRERQTYTVSDLYLSGYDPARSF